MATLVRAGRQAGWKPETTKGMFRLDDTLASWAIADDARDKGLLYTVDKMLSDYLKIGATDRVNTALGRLDPNIFETGSILAILRVTKGFSLPNRVEFARRAGAIVRERIGPERADIVLRSRDAL